MEEMDTQRAEREKKPHEEHNGQVRKAFLEEVSQVPKATTAQGQAWIKPTMEEMEAVAVQIQQLAAPLAAQDFRVVPVKVEDQVRYLVTDISDENYIVQLNQKIGKCNCPSKFFCHHLLAVRFTAGVQADLKIPSNAKLPQPADMGIGFAEKAFSAPAAPSAATEDPVITANKGKALTAEVRKCMHAKFQLSAAHTQAEKDDLEMLATHRLTMDEFRARKAERKMALEDITLKLMDARQALKVHLSKATAAQGQAANTPTMEETDAQRAVKVEDQAKAIISAKMEPTTSSREDTPKEDWNLDLKDLKRRLLKVEALTAEANRLMTEIKAKLPESADMDIGAAEKASLAPAAPTTTSSCEDTDKHEKGLCHPKQRGSPSWSWRLRVSAGRLFRTWTSKTSKDDNLHFDISEA